jgi:ATP-binding cassette, subfamily B (MDR/TAP), member 1
MPNLQYFSLAQVAGARIFSIIDRRPFIDPYGAGKEPVDTQGALELRDVEFFYPARPEMPVFR